MDSIGSILVRELGDINRLIAGTEKEVAEAVEQSDKWLRVREEDKDWQRDQTLATTKIAFYAQRERSIRKNLKIQMKIKRVLLDRLTEPGRGGLTALPTTLDVDVRDRSRELAVALIQPFQEAPATSAQLKAAMAAGLLEKLPVSDRLFPILWLDDWQLTGKFFIQRRQYHADRLEFLMDDILDEPCSNSEEKEVMNQFVWDSFFYRVWTKLVSLLELGGTVTAYRNLSDLRPEFMLFAFNRLMVRLEERRAPSDMDSALESLTQLNDVLPCYLGLIPWVIGVGAAGTMVKAWAFANGQPPLPLCEQMDVSTYRGKFECLKLSINILRAVVSLAPYFRTVEFKPYRQEHRKYGPLNSIAKTIIVDNDRVRKILKPWSVHVSEGFTKLEYVRRAYQEVTGSDHLVRGEFKVPKMDRYRMDVSPVGFERPPKDEQEFKDAVKAVLHALTALHQAGLVHRDIRWKKVLHVEGKGWILIGLETVWKAGDMPLCWLPGWNDHVLEEDRWTMGGQMLEEGKFTAKSDLCLLGKLFDGFRKPWPYGFKLPDSSFQYQEQLLHKKFADAENALQTWCNINTWYKPKHVPKPEGGSHPLPILLR